MLPKILFFVNTGFLKKRMKIRGNKRKPEKEKDYLQQEAVGYRLPAPERGMGRRGAVRVAHQIARLPFKAQQAESGGGAAGSAGINASGRGKGSPRGESSRQD